jgi:DNA-binding response OmpR family regulator
MPRVLIVDDDPGVVAALTDGLTLKGYTVTVASDGPEALEKVKEAWPHVVLLDVKLPTMSGLEVLLCIRSFAPAVEVVMVSGIHDEATVQAALTLGASDYLMKPIRLQDLERSVKDCLTRRRRVTSVPLE